MIKLGFFSAKPYDVKSFSHHLKQFPNIVDCQFFETKLNVKTVPLAKDYDAVCVFVNDIIDDAVLQALQEANVKHVALRCAGFNQVDLEAAKARNITVSRVPAYSPEAVAEHTVGLILTLNRRLHKAYNRVRDSNFQLDGLLGFTLHGKTVGIIGSGNIGLATMKIMHGFGCELLCYDVQENPQALELGAKYVSLERLCVQSDIISLHCPLNDATKHIINEDSLSAMKDGVMLVNTSRGGLIDTNSVIAAIKSGKVGYLALDVYEMESDLFFQDLSDTIIQDDVFARLSRFHNVLITGHQGFFTQEALDEIAHTTLSNVIEVAAGQINEACKVV